MYPGKHSRGVPGHLLRLGCPAPAALSLLGPVLGAVWSMWPKGAESVSPEHTLRAPPSGCP